MVIEDKRITEVRDLTTDEHETLYWSADTAHDPTAIVLDDGITLVASRDPEGNGPGYLVGLPIDNDTLVGALISDARPLSDHEHADLGWTPNHGDVPVVTITPTDNSELDEEIHMYPAADAEQNGPGELWGIDPAADGEQPAVFAVGF